MHIHKVVYLESSHSLVAKVKAAKFPVYQHAVVGVVVVVVVVAVVAVVAVVVVVVVVVETW